MPRSQMHLGVWLMIILFLIGIVVILYLRPKQTEGFLSNGLISAVLDLYKRGYSIISDKVESFSVVYNDDESYLKDFPIDSYTLEETAQQGKFFIDTSNNDAIKSNLKHARGWEVHLLDHIKKYCKPGSIAMDLGAHIGTHTVPMSKYVGNSGTVYAFEPNKKIYRELCYNLASNNLTNVIPVRSAVGNSHEIITIETPDPNNEGGSVARTTSDLKNGNAAYVLNLDRLNLNNVSFMKIDVEGYEANVINGARETIMRNRPVILIEIWDDNQAKKYVGTDNHRQTNIDLMKEFNYSVQNISGDDFIAIPN